MKSKISILSVNSSMNDYQWKLEQYKLDHQRWLKNPHLTKPIKPERPVSFLERIGFTGQREKK